MLVIRFISSEDLYTVTYNTHICTHLPPFFFSLSISLSLFLSSPLERTKTNTSQQSAKVSRSSCCSLRSSSRPIYDGRRKNKISIGRLISRHDAFQLAAIPGIIRIKFLRDLRQRTFAKLERHIMSISLFARFSSDKRQSRAVDCLRGLANRRDSHRSCHKNVTTSHNNFIPSSFPG